MKNYRELEAENKKLRALLQEALQRAIHPSTCACGPDSACTCWIGKAEIFLRPPLQDDKPNFTGLRRMDGEICGKCGHSSTYHTGIWLEDDKPHRCCTKCDCDCQEFVPTGKKNESAR